MLAIAGLGLAGQAVAASDQYIVHPMATSSQLLAPADREDPNMKNAWGLVASPTSPWWTSDNGTDKSTVYPASGAASGLVVTVTGGPTGIVTGAAPSQFPISGGNANFIFDTESGTVQAWRSGTVAEVRYTATDGAIYKGLANAGTGGASQLFAADFHNAKIDVLNNAFQRAAPGAFTDPDVPAGYAPFNVQTIGNRIFVAYAKQDADAEDELDGPGLGYVDAFSTSGMLLGRVASGGALNAPWGVAQAPASFGAFGGDLLVGNFGDGRINAFKETAPNTWTPDGQLRGADGDPLVIGGLWALEFGHGAANNGPTTTLYYTAGPAGEFAGVFGRIEVANLLPVSGTVPATLSLTLGAPASFGAFAPGVPMDYMASTTADVLSTAGSATLSVSDPDTTEPGHLMNGTFSLAQPVQADAASASGTGSAFAAVGGAPTTLLMYAGPVSHDAVTIVFKQTIGATDPLRTGDYAKTFTFTLSTTEP